jgi:hypothetical protein
MRRATCHVPACAGNCTAGHHPRIYCVRALIDNHPRGRVLVWVLREQARVKKRELAEIREIFGRRRRTPNRVLVYRVPPRGNMSTHLACAAGHHAAARRRRVAHSDRLLSRLEGDARAKSRDGLLWCDSGARSRHHAALQQATYSATTGNLQRYNRQLTALQQTTYSATTRRPTAVNGSRRFAPRAESDSAPHG